MCAHLHFREFTVSQNSVIWIYFFPTMKKMQKLFFLSSQVIDKEAAGQAWPQGRISASFSPYCFPDVMEVQVTNLTLSELLRSLF